jgi:hypothetical protein
MNGAVRGRHALTPAVTAGAYTGTEAPLAGGNVLNPFITGKLGGETLIGALSIAVDGIFPRVL